MRGPAQWRRRRGRRRRRPRRRRGRRKPRRSGGGDLRKRATVTDIADGDTIEVRQRGRLRDVRLVGIDTPEVFFGAECGGAEASNSIKRMLQVGDRVTLIRDPTQDNRDAFDRLLRYVERGDRDIGRRQVRQGWAKVFVFESPFRRVGKYRKAQSRARGTIAESGSSAAETFTCPSRSTAALRLASHPADRTAERSPLQNTPPICFGLTFAYQWPLCSFDCSR